MLKVFNLKKSTYYYTLNAIKNDKDADLKQEILAIFQENKSRYGYRRVTLELKNRGINVNHKKVKRKILICTVLLTLSKKWLKMHHFQSFLA